MPATSGPAEPHSRSDHARTRHHRPARAASARRRARAQADPPDLARPSRHHDRRRVCDPAHVGRPQARGRPHVEGPQDRPDVEGDAEHVADRRFPTTARCSTTCSSPTAARFPPAASSCRASRSARVRARQAAHRPGLHDLRRVRRGRLRGAGARDHRRAQPVDRPRHEAAAQGVRHDRRQRGERGRRDRRAAGETAGRRPALGRGDHVA